MSEYTPDTRTIRDSYVSFAAEFYGIRVSNEQFDVWLAKVIYEAKESAWDEGFDAGERDVWEHDRSKNWDICISNPYRAERTN